jgi:hypothetical protein
MYTFAGITFTYLYQITYFAAVMAFAGEMEESGQHSLLLCIPAIQPEMANSRVKRLTMTGSVSREESRRDSGEMDEKGKKPEIADENDQSGKKGLATSLREWLAMKLQSGEHQMDKHQEIHHCRQTFVNHLFRDVYGPFLLTNGTKAYVLLCYSIYALFAIIGLTRIQEGLHPKNLVRSSFYLTEFYVLIDETFWQEGVKEHGTMGTMGMVNGTFMAITFEEIKQMH